MPSLAARAIAAMASISLVLGLGAPALAQTTSTSSSTSTTVVGATTSTSTSTSTTTSTVPQALRCKNRLLTRATKLGRRLSRCDVKLRKKTAKARPFDDTACRAAALESYDRSTTESGRFRRGCLECTLDGIATTRTFISSLAEDVDARLDCAPEVPLADRLKCETKLLRSAANYLAALLRCRKQAALLAFEGGVPDEEGCRTDVRSRYDTAIAKLDCPTCVDTGRIADATREAGDDVIAVAHCPCIFGDPASCPECQACDETDGCVPADEDRPCGRNGCVPEVCDAGACVEGTLVSCSDGDVCTVDTCDDVTDDSCHGTACCTHEPLCDPDALGACVQECTCDPSQGCACRCQPGCDYPGCVVFDAP